MLNEIRKSIVELVKQDRYLDGIDIAYKLKIPVDVAYNEIDVLIDMYVLKRVYYGLQTRLEVIGEFDGSE